MAKGFDRLVVETVHCLYAVGPNIGHCIIVAHPGSGGSEVIIVYRFLGCSVVVAVGAFIGRSPTGDAHSFLIKPLDQAIS